MLQLSPSALGSDVTAAIVKRATEIPTWLGLLRSPRLDLTAVRFNRGLS